TNSRARCWSHLGGYHADPQDEPNQLVIPSNNPSARTSDFEEFSWSGKNSEVSRREAALELRSYLQRIETSQSISKYHLVGHSHGGNVIAYALDRLPFKPAKLGAIVFMGTPFLNCWSASKAMSGWRLYAGILFTIVSIAVLSTYVLLYIPTQNQAALLSV